MITRHGQAIAALVGAEELDTLERLRAAGPEGGLASVAGGWEDSDELVRILETSSRVASRAAPSISELLRPRPLQPFVEWLKTIPRDAQFTSAVTVGELFKGAFRSAAKERHLINIEERVLPAVTILPFDLSTARVFGMIRAELERDGDTLLTPTCKSQRLPSFTTSSSLPETSGISSGSPTSD